MRNGLQRFVLATAALALASAARADGALQALDVLTSSGAHHFQVEIANDEPSRERGLMDRRYLPPDRGMLFEFDRNEPVAFWMKNTYIPLDMVFIARGGVVVRVAADAEPLSLRSVPSGVPCIAVLEINGGEAEAIGLKPGDRIKAAFFGN